MSHPSERRSLVSALIRALGFPGRAIQWFAWRYGKVNRYEVEGQDLVLQKGLFTARRIPSVAIRRWSVRPEMGFDVVEIELEGGEVVTWLDEYNDLLDGLQSLAASKEVSSEGSHGSSQK